MRHLLKSAAAKGFLLTALLLFAASICRAQSVAPETPDYILRSGGMERTYKLHLPAGLPENARWSSSCTATAATTIPTVSP